MSFQPPRIPGVLQRQDRKNAWRPCPFCIGREQSAACARSHRLHSRKALSFEVLNLRSAQNFSSVPGARSALQAKTLEDVLVSC